MEEDSHFDYSNTGSGIFMEQSEQSGCSEVVEEDGYVHIDECNNYVNFIITTALVLLPPLAIINTMFLSMNTLRVVWES